MAMLLQAIYSFDGKVTSFRQSENIFVSTFGLDL